MRHALVLVSANFNAGRREPLPVAVCVIGNGVDLSAHDHRGRGIRQILRQQW
jgi:hypothetical protein